ncbi:hypothetical protein FOZ63_027702, partial [Perkinsus olseni]
MDTLYAYRSDEARRAGLRVHRVNGIGEVGLKRIVTDLKRRKAFNRLMKAIMEHLGVTAAAQQDSQPCEACYDAFALSLEICCDSQLTNVAAEKYRMFMAYDLEKSQPSILHEPTMEDISIDLRPVMGFCNG